ncbi:MAG TPA: sugar transferase [Gemmatimonadales bacterium]|nr:sugar transferase [Gemmatimonadales bacterium]
MTVLLPKGELPVRARIEPAESIDAPPARRLAARFAKGRPKERLYIALCQGFDLGIALVSLVAPLTLANLHDMPRGWQGFLAMRITVENVLLVAAFIVLWRTSFTMCGAYDWQRVRTRSRERQSAVVATTLGSAGTVMFVLHSLSGTFDLWIALYFWLTATALVLLVRITLRAFIFDPSEPGSRDVLIVGSGPRALSVYRRLSGDHQWGGRVVGFVDSNGCIASDEVGQRLLGGLEQLESILMRHALDEVVIALPMRSCYGAIQDTIRVCERVGVRAKYLADVFSVSVATPCFEESRDLPAVAMPVAPEDGRLLLKRLVDIVGSVAGLVALAPVMLLAFLAIRATSRGPALFSQERYGLNKRRFRMYKFRTMVADAEARQATVEHLNEATGPVFKIRNDPRVTPVGRFLRRSSIDELPQLFNVLRGDMSLVGPRPMSVRDVGRFTEPSAMRRFSMRPGITCLWQVNGRSALSYEEWMRLDLEYIDRWSLGLDLRILLRTVPAVIRGVGAA